MRAITKNNMALMIAIAMSGCSQTEFDNITPGSNENLSGELVDISISLQDSPATRSVKSVKPLISEYVKLNTFSATRSPEESDNPKMIGLMELSEDTVSAYPLTREAMASKAQFRVIAFRKVNGNYEYQADAVYEDSGTDSPRLISGSLLVPRDQTYRFVGYSFNKAESIWGTSNYQWGITSVPIPDLNNEFLTFDSTDKTLSGVTYQLPVTFNRQLCKLTVTVVAQGLPSNEISNCTGVYIKQGGDQSSWVLGSSGITPNTNPTAAVNFIKDSGDFNLVPFANPRQITVHFQTVRVGVDLLSNIDVTSSQSVQFLAGKSYKMTINLKGIGISVSESEFNLGGSDCTQSDKQALSKLTWALGNLKSTDNSKPYEWAPSQTDYGYYYTWYSTYTGNVDTTNTDPCSKLDASKYGAGWRTLKQVELDMLSRCTDKVLTNGGMWFMNNQNGLFLPAAGLRDSLEGSGTTTSYFGGKEGYYWSSDARTSSLGYCLYFYNGGALFTSYTNTYGLPVRCVK